MKSTFCLIAILFIWLNGYQAKEYSSEDAEKIFNAIKNENKCAVLQTTYSDDKFKYNFYYCPMGFADTRQNAKLLNMKKYEVMLALNKTTTLESFTENLNKLKNFKLVNYIDVSKKSNCHRTTCVPSITGGDQAALPCECCSVKELKRKLNDDCEITSYKVDLDKINDDTEFDYRESYVRKTCNPPASMFENKTKNSTCKSVNLQLVLKGTDETKSYSFDPQSYEDVQESFDTNSYVCSLGDSSEEKPKERFSNYSNFICHTSDEDEKTADSMMTLFSKIMLRSRKLWVSVKVVKSLLNVEIKKIASL